MPRAVARRRALCDTRCVLRVCAPVVVLLSIVGTRPARAGDGDSALSASLGWATYVTPDKQNKDITPTIGGVVGLTYERGISEALSWRVSLVGGGFAGGGTTFAGWGAAGLVYRFDVLEYVPYVQASLGAIELGGGPVPRGLHPLLELGGGLDLLSNRDRSWGAEVRLGSFAGNTTTVTAGLRATWRWGYF